jgi:hypothetical protein
MTAAASEAALRQRRVDKVRDEVRGALVGELSEKRAKKLEIKADAWSRWFHTKMDEGGVVDPLALLPDALARLEMMHEDFVALAIRDLRASLRKALT